MDINKGVFRTIDANFNRAKEGLRVVEDLFRFIANNNRLRKKIRHLRHELDNLLTPGLIKNLILSRNSKKDLGRKLDKLESSRGSINDIAYSNLQRVKESLRVLEEFFKLKLPAKTKTVKKIRYEVYTLEKELLKKNTLWK
tara:strand:+ start:512 stop:934 length:423 start_codon:yes stop_codon:yes gene_type:complete